VRRRSKTFLCLTIHSAHSRIVNVYIDHSTEPRYYSSIFPASNALSKVVFAAFAWLDVFYCWNHVIFNFTIIITYAYGTCLSLKTITHSNNGRVTGQQTRNLFIFRCLQVTNQMYNVSFSQIVIPISLFVLIVGTITCNYVCIKLLNQIPRMTAVSFLIFACTNLTAIIVAVPIASDIHTLSWKFKKSWLGGHSKKTQQLFRTIRPLRTKVNTLFFFQRVTTFRVLGFLILYTMKSTILF